jgi:hypothetical protein
MTILLVAILLMDISGNFIDGDLLVVILLMAIGGDSIHGNFIDGYSFNGYW